MIKKSLYILISVAFFLILNVGCQKVEQKPPRQVCPGAGNVLQAMERLKPQKTAQFLAKGHCNATFYAEGKKRKESFPVKLWASPPNKLRLHGNVLFNPSGIDLGTNEELFWLAMKPDELGSIYRWDKWQDADYLEKMTLDPRIFMEALGLKNPADSYNSVFLLKNSKYDDILIKKDKNGNLKEKIFIDKCSYQIRKIHYYGDSGKLFAIAVMKNYVTLIDDFAVPEIINFQKLPITELSEAAKIDLELKKTETEDFNEKQMEIYFSRPDTRGYEKVYKLSELNL